MRNNSWIALTLGMIVVFSSLCFAGLPSSAIGLGGVTPGDSVEVAKYKFGVPNVRGDKFYFSNGVVVEIDSKQPDVIEEIKTKNSKVNTPAGVTVGMSEYVLNDHYGAADKVENDSDGDVEYKYFSVDGQKKMTFKVHNGVIQKIKCEKC